MTPKKRTKAQAVYLTALEVEAICFSAENSINDPDFCRGCLGTKKTSAVYRAIKKLEAGRADELRAVRSKDEF